MHLVLDGVSLEQGGDVWLKDINLELSSGMTVLIGQTSPPCSKLTPSSTRCTGHDPPCPQGASNE